MLFVQACDVVISCKLMSSQVKSSQFYLYNLISQITICLRGLYNLYSTRHALQFKSTVSYSFSSAVYFLPKRQLVDSSAGYSSKEIAHALLLLIGS